MTTLEIISRIDAAYDPDPAATIDVLGTVDGKECHFLIHNDGSGPVVWPGFWFLPYGGVWFNPVSLKIREAD
jgi:hypothetical protein